MISELRLANNPHWRMKCFLERLRCWLNLNISLKFVTMSSLLRRLQAGETSGFPLFTILRHTFPAFKINVTAIDAILLLTPVGQEKLVYSVESQTPANYLSADHRIPFSWPIFTPSFNNFVSSSFHTFSAAILSLTYPSNANRQSI